MIFNRFGDLLLRLLCILAFHFYRPQPHLPSPTVVYFTFFLFALRSVCLLNAAGTDEVRLRKDDGQSLWASPTDGPPLVASFWPNNVRLVIALRPAALLGTKEGQRIYQALAPRVDGLVNDLQSSTGRQLSNFASLTLLAVPEADRLPGWTIEAQLVDDQPIQWDAPAMLVPANFPFQLRQGHYRRLKDQAWFEFATTSGTQLLAGDEKKLLERFNAKSIDGLYSRKMETLIKNSDLQRHVTVLVSISFLLGDAKKWFSPELAWVVEMADRLLFEKVDSLLLSLHLGPSHQFYGEVQVFHSLDARPGPLSLKLQEEIDKVPDRVENYLVNLDTIDKHWRRLAMRLPQMTRLLVRKTRVAVENQHPVITFSLPTQAAHNFAAAIELAHASTSGLTVGSSATQHLAPSIRSWNSLLRQKIDLEIRQDSLEATLEIFQSQIVEAFPVIQFPFRIRIIGSDLKKEGITRNQQIRNLRQTREKISDILTALVLSANPVTTVKSPSEKDQKLIWTIARDPDARDERIILITTRQAAKSKGYPLPPAFRP